MKKNQRVRCKKRFENWLRVSGRKLDFSEYDRFSNHTEVNFRPVIVSNYPIYVLGGTKFGETKKICHHRPNRFFFIRVRVLILRFYEN